MTDLRTEAKELCGRECRNRLFAFTPVTTISFLLNEICDGGSSKEPFLKARNLIYFDLGLPLRNENKQWEFYKCRHFAA